MKSYLLSVVKFVEGLRDSMPQAPNYATGNKDI